MQENFEAYKDAVAVFGSMEEAQTAAPLMTKLKFANGALFGKSEEESERQNKDMLRTIDLQGGANNSEEFKKQADYIQKATNATGGLVGGSDFFQLIQRGSIAVKAMSNEAVYQKLLPLLQEMGGDTLGTSLMSLNSNLVQGHTTKGAVKNLTQAGLIDPKKVAYDGKGEAIFTKATLKNSDQFKKDPTEWAEKTFLPQMIKIGRIP